MIKFLSKVKKLHGKNAEKKCKIIFSHPADIYLFKINIGNIESMCEICYVDFTSTDRCQ